MQKRNPVYVGIYPFALAVDALLWPFFKFIVRDKFSTLRMGRLSFYGDIRLHDLAGPSLERIREIDPTIHSEIMDTPMIFTTEWKGEKRKESLPVRSTSRGRFCIYDWMIDEGIDSVVFGIVDYYHRYQARAETPFIARVLDPSLWSQESMNRTKDWLTRFEFNKESIEYLETTWYSKN